MSADVINLGTVAFHQGCGGTIGFSYDGLRICNRCALEVLPGETVIGHEAFLLAPGTWDGTGPHSPVVAADASHLLSEYFTYVAVSDLQGPAAAALDTGADISVHAERMAVVLQQLQIENSLLRELCGRSEIPAPSSEPILSESIEHPISDGWRLGAAADTGADIRSRAEQVAFALHQLVIENSPLRQQYMAKLEPDLGLEL